MCGISGIVSKQGNTNIVPLLVKTTELLAHRGPDDEGYFFMHAASQNCYYGEATPKSVLEYTLPYTPKHAVEEAFNQHASLGLGHRRLTILDLSPNGHQPMCLSDDLWIVYNGEVYNYIEIRQTLIQKGYTFKTSTDTEVLLAAYQEWGIHMLEKLNGMWAFVIYDRKKNILFGSRDRFGVKPLYYTATDAFFAFASEIKALTHLTDTEINTEAAWEYLVHGKHETIRSTLFNDICELKPAEYFIYDLDSNIHEIKNYYQLEYNTAWESYTKQQLDTQVEEIQHQLKESIRIRMRSDVPLGASLSGGLDSSTIVQHLLAMMSENHSTTLLNLFTAHFPDVKEDEFSWAEKIAKQKNTHWHIVEPNATELATELDDLIYTQDIPFFSMSVYSHYKLMQHFQKHGIKINFDGQGSDELFGGYQKHYNCFLWDALTHSDYTVFLENIKSPNFSSFNSPKKFLKQFGKQTIQSLPLLQNIYTPQIQKYLNTDFVRSFSSNISSYRKEEKLQPLNQFLHQQFCGPDLKVLLRMGDRNSMRFGVESRTPFADDHILIEKIFSLSASLKIHKGHSKYLLRKATKNFLPEEIRLRRDKVGYATPEAAWYKAIHKELYDSIPEQDDEFILYSKLKKDWFNLIQSSNDPGRLWRIINFMKWKEGIK
ncbi:MAG: asparagine synthase (glutamine-hydrolyzing) [Cytophaga sp.]|uniref:asparagine synthase (glutamine-hydrolyzing) n=1 Tax=Cytophaga sp. TaxID=29535 RepID=UPI003F7EF7DB